MSIRTVDELEDLRVVLTDKLAEAKAAMRSQDDLLQVKAIRTELNDVVDQLLLAKNVEADQFKAKQLDDIRRHEKESAEHKAEYIKLIEPIVTALERMVKTLPRVKQLAASMSSNRSSIEARGSKYNAEYGEAEVFTPGGCRGVPDCDQVKRMLEWLKGDLDSYKAKFIGKAGKAEAKLATDELSGGSKVMQSVIKAEKSG